MPGRLVHAADFKSVLATLPRVRSAHFAAHHVAACPSLPSRGGTERRSAELSTGDAPKLTSSVDNSAPRGLWLGTVVPKRLARRAVTRLLLKRQMRAAIARHAARLPAGLWVLRLRTGFDPRQFPSAASHPLRHAARAELDALLAAATDR
jgi:ribonuclease P protein component